MSICPIWNFTLYVTQSLHFFENHPYVYHSDLSHYVSDCTVSVSLRRVICLLQWFVTLWQCLWLYCITITKESDICLSLYHSDLSLYVSDCTVSVSLLRRVISLSQWFITLCLTVLNQYHLRRVISLSQWFITLSWLCLWLNCISISITKESDKSITVIYHTMSLTVLYQYH
jgi:hypothetical protein